MSRNLSRTTCRTCDGQVILTDIPYVHRHNAERIVVANAECKDCGTRYLAWLNEPDADRRFPVGHRMDEHGGGFYDLSYRSTFNDEPGITDIPNKVEVIEVVRVNGKVAAERTRT